MTQFINASEFPLHVGVLSHADPEDETIGNAIVLSGGEFVPGSAVVLEPGDVVETAYFDGDDAPARPSALLTEEEVNAHLDPDDDEHLEADLPAFLRSAPPVPDAEADISTLRKPELVALAEERGIDPTGLKVDELRAALVADSAQGGADGGQDGVGEVPAASTDTVGIPTPENGAQGAPDETDPAAPAEDEASAAGGTGTDPQEV